MSTGGYSNNSILPWKYFCKRKVNARTSPRGSEKWSVGVEKRDWCWFFGSCDKDEDLFGLEFELNVNNSGGGNNTENGGGVAVTEKWYLTGIISDSQPGCNSTISNTTIQSYYYIPNQ
jgi:hypothetical protein